MRARAERDRDPAFAFPDDGRWALTWEDLLKLRPPRRAARPRRDGGQDPLPEVQHRAVRPRHAARGRRGGGAEAGRRRGGQGLRGRGRGRPDARRQPRDAQLRLGPRPRRTSSSWSTGTTSASTTPAISRWCTARRPAGSPRYGWRVTGTRAGHGVGAGDAGGARGGARRRTRSGVPSHGLVQDAQGPRLRQVRQQEPRHAARP